MNPLTKKQRLTPLLHFFFFKERNKKASYLHNFHNGSFYFFSAFLSGEHFFTSGTVELKFHPDIHDCFFIFIFNFFIPTRLVFRGAGDRASQTNACHHHSLDFPSVRQFMNCPFMQCD